MLRGEDTYKNLPNKTLRLLRYALAHPAGGCVQGQIRATVAWSWEAEGLVGPGKETSGSLPAAASWHDAAAARVHLRCTLPGPAGYTHVMKTDDDCYVRIGKVRAWHCHTSAVCGTTCIQHRLGWLVG